MYRALRSLSVASLLIACSGGGAAPNPPAHRADRMPGARAPRSARCDDTDSVRCLLPWPSNAFTVVDGASATGLRLHVDARDLGRGDEATQTNRADGFSRASPILTGFTANLDEASIGDGLTGAVRLLVTEPGDAFGTAVPLRFHLIPADDPRQPESVVVAYPRHPMRAASEHLAVVLDSLRVSDGPALAADRNTRVALGLAAPTTDDEEALRAYHAPSRAALLRAGIDPAHVLRLWDFTTRSAEQPLRPLKIMRDAAFAALTTPGRVSITIDRVTVNATGAAQLIVLGHLRGLPRWTDASKKIARDAEGRPTPIAGMTFDAPFRALVPRGTGDYRVVLYGHGTGGTVDDDSFDGPIAEEGASKIGIQFDGLTSGDVVQTFAGFQRLQLGTEQCASGLAQSLAGGMAILASVLGHLPDGTPVPASASLRAALGAPMIGDMVNPAAGRFARDDHPVWAGGSLGGTMGLTLSRAEPTLTGAVLNVPGAAWSHFLTYSNLYGVVRATLQVTYPSEVDVFQQVAAAQNHWDEVDGAAWSDALSSPPTVLLQQSMGDPVLPGIGTEFAAAAVGASQVGVVLSEVPAAQRAMSVDNASALTQFRVPTTVTGPLDVHGFAARDTPAGVAAREQIRAYLTSVWSGRPRIEVPPTCHQNAPVDSCDFAVAR